MFGEGIEGFVGVGALAGKSHEPRVIHKKLFIEIAERGSQMKSGRARVFIVKLKLSKCIQAQHRVLNASMCSV
jgi:hypothetical protein